MRKAMFLAVGLLVAAALPASADEVRGTVKSIDRTDSSIILDDGTKLTVGERSISNLTAGDQVKAMYQTQGGKNVVSDIGVRGIGSEIRGTTAWGPSFGTEIDSQQAE